MIHNSTLTFLKQLKRHNNRAWFAKNKPKYEAARENFEDFVGELILAIGSFDPSVRGLMAKDALFRIYRDMRFSKDKSPYKTHFGVAVVAGGRKSGRAGYYFHLAPSKSSLAGGLHGVPSKQLTSLRRAIDRDGKMLKRIITSRQFRSTFGEMQGDQLKSAPRGYATDHPYINLLRYKDFLAIHPLADSKVLSGNLVKNCVRVFKAMRPFNDFLNRAVHEAE